jgi:hypothetical protein
MKITMPRLLELARGKRSSENDFAGGWIEPNAVVTVVDGVVVDMWFERKEFGEELEPLPEGQYRFSVSKLDWKELINECDRLGIPVNFGFAFTTPSYSKHEYPTLIVSVGNISQDCICYDRELSHG